MAMEPYKKASMIVVIDSLIASFALACAVVIFSAPVPMVDRVIGPELESPTINLQQERDYVTAVLRLTGAILITFLAINFLLILMLHAGTRNKSVNKLRGWLIANSLLTGLILCETLLIGGFDEAGKVVAKIPNILFILYRIFSMQIVWKFLCQVKVDERSRDLDQIKISTEENTSVPPQVMEGNEGIIKNLD